MNQFLKDQVAALGLFKVMLLIWSMTLITIVVIWALLQPQETQSILLAIGGSVFGVFATVVAVVFKKQADEGLTTKIRRVLDDGTKDRTPG